MKVKVPAFAPLTPPDTGASMKETFLEVAASDICCETLGLIVDESMRRQFVLTSGKIPALLSKYVDKT